MTNTVIVSTDTVIVSTERPILTINTGIQGPPGPPGDDSLTADELAAIQGAASPDADNPFATIADVESGVAGVASFEGRTGTVTAVAGDYQASEITVDASGFDGNLTTADNTVQKVAQKLDDLVAGAGSLSDGDTLTTGLTFPLAGLHILDTNASHDLIVSPGSDLTADRTLTIVTGDSDRTLTLTGNASVEGTNTGDQDLSGYLTKATYDANSILAATADNTPAAVTVAEQTLVGRITGGAIDDLSATQVRTLLNVADGATAAGAIGDAFASSHPGGNQHIDWTSDQGATDIHSGNIPDLSATYATAAKGVTNGDSHDHSGGDGAQISYSNLSNTPTLGTAAALDVGTDALDVVQLDASAKLPAVDGSQLTNLPVGDVVITTDTTVYVEVTGNDTTGDGTSVGTAYATVQKAIDSIQSWIILNPAIVTIQLGAGDFTISDVIRFRHPYGIRIKLLGVAPSNQITGVVEADFTDPLAPVPGTRGAFDLYNSAGMLSTSADSATRSAARAQDLIDNEALLRSCYPTRIYRSAGASLAFASGCSDFGNILFKGTVSTTAPETVFSLGSYAVLSGTGMTASQNAVASLATVVCADNAVAFGLTASYDSVIAITNFYGQGVSRGIHAFHGGRIDATKITISGFSNHGAQIETNGVLSTLTSSVNRRISFSGGALSGVVMYTGGLLNFANGSSGSLLNVSGNAGEQITVADNVAILSPSSGVAVRLQASPTGTCIRLQRKSNITLGGPVTLNGGTYAIHAQNDSEMAIMAATTYTNPGTQFARVETGSTLFLNGAVTAAAGLGTTGITASGGARIYDAGSVLSALAATDPTKFSPTFGKTLADGSAIIGGPVGTGFLAVRENTVEAAPSLSVASGTITANAPALNLTQTWNNAAVIFTGLNLDIATTAYSTNSQLFDVKRNGTSVFKIGFNGVTTVSGTLIAQTLVANTAAATLTLSNAADLILARGGAGILEQRVGANAQTYCLYNTYTDASNYERLSIGWSGNVCTIAPEASGTGTLRSLKIGSNLGIGVAPASAGLHVVKTTEQLRLGYDAANYASMTVSSAGELTIAATGGVVVSGLSGSTQSFGTISVSGQSNVVADAAPDTLTLVAGTGITITTDASADSITLSASLSAVKLDDLTAPDDNTDLDASTSTHGLAPKAVAPSAGALNAYGIANGETAIANKTIFEGLMKVVVLTRAAYDALGPGRPATTLYICNG